MKEEEYEKGRERGREGGGREGGRKREMREEEMEKKEGQREKEGGRKLDSWAPSVPPYSQRLQLQGPSSSARKEAPEIAWLMRESLIPDFLQKREEGSVPPSQWGTAPQEVF